MGDKGRKDKNKHDKQVNKAKDTQNEANKKKQEKAHQQNKGYASIRNITVSTRSVRHCERSEATEDVMLNDRRKSLQGEVPRAPRTADRGRNVERPKEVPLGRSAESTANSPEWYTLNTTISIDNIPIKALSDRFGISESVLFKAVKDLDLLETS